MVVCLYMTYFFETYHTSIATLIAGSVALIIYYKAKRDELKTAAKTIILEIKEAEKIIKMYIDIKNSGNSYPTDFYKITPHKAWDKYSYLFIKKLNNDEYQQINDFYKKGEILEKYVEKNYNFFWVTTEERARLKEKIGYDEAFKLISVDPSVLDNIEEGQYRDHIEKIALLYMSNTRVYVPVGIKTEIDKVLNSISLIINTPTWNNLKKIADYSDMLG